MITEADTCRKYVVPKLHAAGWTDDQMEELMPSILNKTISETDENNQTTFEFE